ncbi:MAG: hypothetical protein GYA62_06880, partial [Bacteroidales bacterium]|nr:hypothetical protein [Bacteroidales bacterium]
MRNTLTSTPCRYNCYVFIGLHDISKKLDIISSGFGISIGCVESTAQPNIQIYDYTSMEVEENKKEFPASAIKDVVGLVNLLEDIYCTE